MLTNAWNWFLARGMFVKVLLLILGGVLLNVRRSLDDRVILRFTWGQVVMNMFTFGWYRTMILNGAYPAAQKDLVRDIIVDLHADSTAEFRKVADQVNTLEVRFNGLEAKILQLPTEMMTAIKKEGPSLFQIPEDATEPAAKAA